ncbi:MULTISPECIES: zinc-binding metallopeptidase family protein [unclassified Haematobacter]|uniref:zinc-binding metallopeptidase family protein n=1 Tax=unclassified Haematobacter TaxID=2640585 RepID=UPI0025C6FB59|nr:MULTISPECIES: putative zinc-binding peptidase [unclassified Haematobacter]
MKLFHCQNCQQVVYFENTACVKCGMTLGYLPDQGEMSSVAPDGPNWTAMANPGTLYRFCANWEQSACNWMVTTDSQDTLCFACQHNRTIPDISSPENHALWQKMEQAKRRLFYTIIKLGLPAPTASSGAAEPLVFDFLADDPESGEKVVTGHDNGVITLSLNEADDAFRAKMQEELHEPYRTLLGHFRHEVGHYYWDILVRDGGHLEDFRALFGDERESYQEALERHYQNGAPPDWQENYISAYATMHPWEDWAETWAHYLHIIDTLEMARAFGITVNAAVTGDPDAEVSVDVDPHRAWRFTPLIDAWLPLTFAVNSLNRAMGQPDLYPFVLSPKVIDKLCYIHGLVQANRIGRLRQQP